MRIGLTTGTARDFIELVIPQLRCGSRFRKSYADGETLRERLFGAGNARLLDDQPAPASATRPAQWESRLAVRPLRCRYA
jgi:hypothetical protein